MTRERAPPVAQTDDQRRASRAVGAWLSLHERNPAWLVRQTGADPGTIGDFLNGNRWPKYGTQGKVEKALGWPAGSLTAIADGGQPPSLQPGDLEEPGVDEEPAEPLLSEATDEELAAEVLRRMTPHGGPTRGQRQSREGQE